jgi:hypothetical protein
MNKKDFFTLAMQAGNYKKLNWIISAFSIIRENADAYKEMPFPYRIVNDPLGFSFCPEDKPLELVKLEDAKAGQALFLFNEVVEVNPEDIPNCKEKVLTTYGNLLYNWIVLVHAFGSKIPFQTGRINGRKIEDLILVNFKDTPKNDSDRKENECYVDEYLKYTAATDFLTGLTQLCVWGSSEKTLLAPPGIKEFKKKLLEENKDTLDQTATVAKIDAELVKYDAAFLKDSPAENFLIGGKSRNVVRKKLFLMIGTELGLDENSVKSSLITNSLSEGWDYNKIPEMIDSLRAGSFNRGAQTVLGGVSVKWLLRASSNINVTIDDCGTTIGGVVNVTEKNKDKYIGFSVVTKEGSKKIISSEEAGTYLGKTIMIRNPMYCKLPQTDYCKVCVGDRLAVNPTGLSIAVSDYGNSFLSIFLAASHAKQISTAKMNIQTAIT